MIFNKKGQAFNLLVLSGRRLISLGAGFVVALLAGIPLFFQTTKNIITPPQQTSPPLWVIIIIAIILIAILKRK